MAKTSKGVILSQASQIKSDYSFALIKATADNKSLVQDASSAELKVNALVEYSKDSQWDPKELSHLGFPAGCFLIVDLRGQDIHAADLITNLALVRQYGYQAGVIDDLSTLDDIKVLKTNQIYLINSGKVNDDQDASLNGDEITDGSGKLAVGMSVKWQRDYTNVDVSGDHAGFVGMGQDTLLKGGNAFGYSTNGRDFNAVITPKGLIFRRPDAERMWRLLKPNEIADINSTVGDKVKKEVDSATAEIPAAVSAANSAVSAAESAIAASKVNSDAIVAQSEAISEAKSAMDSATAEIQQTAANAASDAAKIRADVARVQSEVDTTKAANSASVEALKSDIGSAKKDLADIHDSLDKAQSAIEQNQKLINDSVAKITSDVSATKQDLADVHDSLTKAQAAAEQNQKAIDKSIAQINDSVDATNQDLADVRKDLTKAQSDITANQKAVNDNVAQINADITQDRKDIASAQQANADTAKQLDDYSKQATEQGKTIKTIQDKQDGFSATLADVQGNVSQVSDKVDGLSASLKDAQGNVASVKAQADQLSATLTDHANSIATLTASAKELSSTLEDADGRLSKVEQTAQDNSSTLADVQGDLSKVTQTATGLVSTLKDAQGNISTLQQKTDSVSARLATAQGDIASLQTDVTGIKATLISHEGDIHTLQSDSKTLKDDMTDAQGNISSLQKSSTKLNSEFSSQDGRLSKVEQTANEHTSTISSLGDKLNNMKIGGRNLLQGTAKFNFPLNTNGGTQTIQKYDDETNYVQHTSGTPLNGMGPWWPFTPEVGQVYTLSADVCGNGYIQGGEFHYEGADNGSLGQVNLTNNWQRISNTFRVNTIAGNWVIYANNSTLLKVKHIKIEKGNVATDWTPAPEDLATVTQVKQTADGIETTLKSAQGDIDQIKQTAKGTSEQLADVQGNVTNIQKDVTGLKQTTADNAGNIHTLQSDSKSLHDSMQDAQGDISTLKKTSTDVTAELQDHAGRISKTEQTASTLVNELADQQGHLNRVEQKATGTEQTVANQQGQINSIQTDVSGVHQTITGQGNQIANINVTLNGLNTKYEGVSGDLSKLSDKVTTNSTQIDQNQQAIALKADQSTVNNLSGEVSQAQAQLKVQADQISSKVSSTDFKTLNDKVNGMQIGGRNLVTGTAEPYTMCDAIPDTTWQNSYACEALPVTVNGYEILPKGDGYHATLIPGKEYTQTIWIETDARIAKNGLEFTWYTDVGHDEQPANIVKIANNSYKLVSTYTWPGKTYNNVRLFDTFYLTEAFDLSTGTYLKFGKLKLEEGNVSTDWTPAPEDTIAAIQKNTTAIDQADQKISLKADQIEVDQIKNTASQNSSRLDVMANEISSKVTSTDVNNIVDSKGYATTSTVQSLVDQKAGTLNESITNLTNKLVNNNGGGVNLVSGTIEDIVVDDTANTGTQGWCFNTIPINADLKVGDKITVSVEDVTMTGRGDLSKWGVTLYSKDISEMRANNYEANTGKNTQVTITVTSMNDPNKQTALLIYSGRVGDTEGKKAVFHHLKVERGEIATPYSPAPSDNATVTQLQSVTASIDGLQSRVTNYQNDTSSKYTQLSDLVQSKVGTADFEQLKRSVDMQTLDSADINNMKTNGHYFVHNLTNSPIAGWVYVDVTGNGNNRIRQDVYQDTGIQHKYRRWFDTHWTGWEEGATYTEITQLQDAVNLRVQKGELLSQINLTAGNTLIQSNKLYLDASSVVFSGRAFIPSAAITNIDADKITTGTLNGIDIHQIATKEGRSIDISGGNITLSSSDPYESRLSFKYQGQMVKMFNATGDLEADTWGIFNFSPSDTQNLHPIQFFRINNVGGKGSGSARMQLDHAIFDGHEWWANFDGITFGRSYDGINGSNDYVDLYAKSFLPHSQLSSKTRIEKLNGEDAMNMIKQVQMYTYQFKDDVRDGKTKRYASLIIDDVHDVAQYTEPDIFVADNKKCRDDGTQLAYAIAAIQYQQHEIEELKVQLKEKKANE